MAWQNSHLVLLGVVGGQSFLIAGLEHCHGLATCVGDEVGTSSPTGGELGRMPAPQTLPSCLEAVKLRRSTLESLPLQLMLMLALPNQHTNHLSDAYKSCETSEGAAQMV